MAITRLNNNSITSVTALPSGVGGKILQVQNGTQTSRFNTTSSTFVDVTGFSVNITPTSTSNQIYIMFNVTAHSATIGGYDVGMRLLRDSTSVAVSADETQSLGYIRGIENSGGSTRDLMFHAYDSPNTTSQVTYKIQTRVDTGGTVYFGGTYTSPDWDLYQTITAMEIAG